MRRAMTVTLCRLLVVLMAWTPWQMAQAGMIGTESSVASAAALDRAAVLGLIARADIASQLQNLGIDQATARERVAAMSDEEVRTLHGRIESLPAGGISHGAKVLIVVLIIAGVVWWAISAQGTRR